MNAKIVFYSRWGTILFSQPALGWRVGFMWSFLHLYSLVIILYNQKVLQPKGPSVLNYDIWKQPTGHPSLTKSERLHANTDSRTYTHTHTLCKQYSFVFLHGYSDDGPWLLRRSAQLGIACSADLLASYVIAAMCCITACRPTLGLPWNSILFEITSFFFFFFLLQWSMIPWSWFCETCAILCHFIFWGRTCNFQKDAIYFYFFSCAP